MAARAGRADAVESSAGGARDGRYELDSAETAECMMNGRHRSPVSAFFLFLLLLFDFAANYSKELGEVGAFHSHNRTGWGLIDTSVSM